MIDSNFKYTAIINCVAAMLQQQLIEKYLSKYFIFEIKKPSKVNIIHRLTTSQQLFWKHRNSSVCLCKHYVANSQCQLRASEALKM